MSTFITFPVRQYLNFVDVQGGFKTNMIINMIIIYSFLYFYVLCFLLVLPFIYLFQVHNLTLARCFLLALKLWRKSEIIEFVHKT